MDLMKFKNDGSYDIEGELEDVAYEIRLVIWINYGLLIKELRRFFSDVGTTIPWKVCIEKNLPYVEWFIKVLGHQVMKREYRGYVR